MRFDVTPVALPPGSARTYDAAEWRDALVLVERGEVELEFTGGARLRLARGATLWLARLPLRALHNPGAVPLLLVAVARQDRRRLP